MKMIVATLAMLAALISGTVSAETAECYTIDCFYKANNGYPVCRN